MQRNCLRRLQEQERGREVGTCTDAHYVVVLFVDFYKVGLNLVVSE